MDNPEIQTHKKNQNKNKKTTDTQSLQGYRSADIRNLKFAC